MTYLTSGANLAGISAAGTTTFAISAEVSILNTAVSNTMNVAGIADQIAEHPAVGLTHILMGGLARKLKRHGARPACNSPALVPPPLSSPEPTQKQNKPRHPIFQKLISLFWNPSRANLHADAYVALRDLMIAEIPVGETPVIPSRGAFYHERGNPVTDRLTEIVSRCFKSKDRESEQDLVLELGSGDGALAVIVSERTGVRVREVDLFATVDRGKMGRTIADIRDLHMFADEQFPVVLTSFAAEYAGRKAWEEACRVLAPGGMLVALVHHQGSSIVMSGRQSGIFSLVKKLYYVLASCRPTRFLLPTFILEGWLGSGARLTDHLARAAFHSKDQVQRLLQGVGFSPYIHFEDAKSPYIMKAARRIFGDKLLPVGWIVTATKPKEKRLKKA